MPGDLFVALAVQAFDIGETATQHNRVRVQNVDYRGEGAAKPFQEGLHRLFGDFVAAGCQVNRVFGCGAGGLREFSAPVITLAKVEFEDQGLTVYE